MMNARQLKEKIIILEKELAILKSILEAPATPHTMGRPIGSTIYPAERIVFLEECEKQGLSDAEIIVKFNEKFATQVPKNSRQLYNLMQRRGSERQDGDGNET